MFNSFSFSELLFVLLVVVIVFGPDRLPEMARKLGQWTAKARQSVENLKRELGTEYKDVIDPIRDARSDLRGLRQELKDTTKSVVSDLDSAAGDVRDAVDPKKVGRSLTPEDIKRSRQTGPTAAKSLDELAESGKSQVEPAAPSTPDEPGTPEPESTP